MAIPNQTPAFSKIPRPAMASVADLGHAHGHDHHDHAHHDHAGHSHGHASLHRHEAGAPHATRTAGTPRLSLIALSGLQRLLLVAPAIALLWLLTFWAMSNGPLSNG